MTWLVAPAAARSLLVAALAAALFVIGATALRLIPIGVPARPSRPSSRCCGARAPSSCWR